MPIDDEPPKPSRKNRSRDIRHSKLLAETGYYTGFLEKQPPSSSSSASLAAFVPRWPPRWYGSFGSYDGYDHRDGCRRAHARHRRAAYRQILVVCTLFLTAAYAAFRLSCVVHAASGPYSPLHPASSPAAYSELDVWIEEEAHTALRAVLANIGPAAGAADGIVVASPSTGGPNEPNYYVRMLSPPLNLFT